jgi:hypothetical protein
VNICPTARLIDTQRSWSSDSATERVCPQLSLKDLAQPSVAAGASMSIVQPSVTTLLERLKSALNERQVVYSSFKDFVVIAAQNNLKLYIDIHQNGRQPHMEVATWGISKDEARLIQKTYRKVRGSSSQTRARSNAGRAIDRAAGHD